LFDALISGVALSQDAKIIADDDYFAQVDGLTQIPLEKAAEMNF